jgi:hypothetical protein
VRLFAQQVQLERLVSTTDDGLEDRPAWGPPQTVTALLMPPSSSVEQAAALRNESVSFVGLFPRGINLSSETTRITVQGTRYRVGRVTRIPTGESVQLTEE